MNRLCLNKASIYVPLVKIIFSTGVHGKEEEEEEQQLIQWYHRHTQATESNNILEFVIFLIFKLSSWVELFLF